eukprot:jgi/Ulvmu1/8744/UM047_0086.1
MRYCPHRQPRFAQSHPLARRHRRLRCQATPDKLSYKDAGVDIDAGNELVNRIKNLNPDIGGFNGMFPFGDSYLVAGTDGVGTKLKLAFEMEKHDTIGIDLVAMCVNDVVVCGAKPLFFLDYYATGKLDVDVAEQVVKGINAACVEVGALLLGGETAEMPGMYSGGEYDVAGFAVGAVKKADVVTGDDIAPGNVLIGLPSTGVHSNGFSLVRKVLERSGISLHDPAPWDESMKAGLSLLTPTALYVNALIQLRNDCGYKGAVHITGGGFYENIPRVIPKGMGCKIDSAAWTPLPIFEWLQGQGGISRDEMFRTFNMGVGMVVAAAPADLDRTLELLPGSFVLGEVVDGGGVQIS